MPMSGKFRERIILRKYAVKNFETEDSEEILTKVRKILKLAI